VKADLKIMCVGGAWPLHCGGWENVRVPRPAFHTNLNVGEMLAVRQVALPPAHIGGKE
jgi:hypothetical protein